MSPHRPPVLRRALRCLIAMLATVLLAVAPLPGGTAARADEPTAPPASTASPSTFTGTGADPSAPSTRSPGDARRTVVLIAVPGLRWSDVDKNMTPTLWKLVNNGPVGTLSVRSVLTPTCVIDAWLMISAGRAISDAAHTPACPVPPEPEGDLVPDWARYERQAAAEEGRPVPGTLGDHLHGSRQRVVAIGPGAAIATATRDGVVAGDYLAPSPSYGAAFTRAVSQQPDLVVIDAGRIWLVPERPARAAQVSAVEHVVAQITPLLPQGATVVLAGTGSSDADPRLGLVAMSGYDRGGERFRAGILGSGSSRQSGLLRVPDITATVLDLLGLKVPAGIDGAPMRVVAQEGASSEETIQQVADRERATGTVDPLSVWFVSGIVVANLALYAYAWWVLRRLRERVILAESDDATRHSTDGAAVAQAEERRGLALLRYAGLVLGALPVVTFVASLIPWWRSTLPGLALTPVLMGLAVAVMTIALSEPWRRVPTGPAAAVGGITAAVLGLDAASGSQLQLDPLLGGGQQTSGRLLGMSDPGVALFLTGALVLAIGLADWAWRHGRARRAAVPVLALGLICGLVAGLPQLGDNASGVITLAAGFLLLSVAVGGVRFTWRKVLTAALGTTLVVAALAAVDLQRDPAHRTRLGRFASGLLHGGAGDVLRRKLDTVLDATASSILTWLIPATILFIAVVLLRTAPGETRAPLRAVAVPTGVVRRGSAVVAATLALGFLTHDAGAAVPAMGLALAVPLLVATIAQERLIRRYGLEDALFAAPAGRWPWMRRITEDARERPVGPAAPTWAERVRAQGRRLP